MVDTLEEYKKQHLCNYKNAILDIIKNNSDVLVDEDIMSLIRKPPLDSMDLIKSKFLDLAKKNRLIINSEKLDNLLDKYRRSVSNDLVNIKKTRIEYLSAIVESTEISKDSDVIKFTKKCFNDLNKGLKKEIKDLIQSNLDNIIMKKYDSAFSDEMSNDIKEKIASELKKYFKNIYQKQLIDNIDFKFLVKDTTLSNVAKEHGERFVFTLNNSRIFQQEKDN